MHQSVKLTDAIWFLHLAISSAFIHALGDPNQEPERQTTYKLSYPSPLIYHYSAWRPADELSAHSFFSYEGLST